MARARGGGAGQQMGRRVANIDTSADAGADTHTDAAARWARPRAAGTSNSIRQHASSGISGARTGDDGRVHVRKAALLEKGVRREGGVASENGFAPHKDTRPMRAAATLAARARALAPAALAALPLAWALSHASSAASDAPPPVVAGDAPPPTPPPFVPPTAGALERFFRTEPPPHVRCSVRCSAAAAAGTARF